MEDKKQNRLGSQSTLAASAKGRWSEILSILAPELDDAIAMHTTRSPHVSCPNHGGKDGFRLFTGLGSGFNDTGGGICNTCGPMRDGFRLLTWIYITRDNGKVEPNFKMSDYPDVLKRAYSDIAFYLAHGYAKNPELRNRAPRIMDATTEAELKEKEEQERKRREHLMLLGQKMWGGGISGHKMIAQYFKDRGSNDIVTSDLMKLNPQTPYFGKDEQGYKPAIIMPVTRVEDGKVKVIALHRIYVHEHEDGRVTKAPVEDPKKIMPWGNLEGAAIRLYPVKDNVLVVGEGVETMASVHSFTNLGAWSCVTAWGLETFQIPESVETIIIAQDYDLSGKGQSSAQKLAERVKAAGKTAIIISPETFYNSSNPNHSKGCDWDDAFRENPDMARKMWEPYMVLNAPTIGNNS